MRGLELPEPDPSSIRDTLTMPDDRPITLEGPLGHTAGALREWDYDRGGSAYQITCECGTKTQQVWNLRDAKNQHAQHVAVSQITWRGANTGDLLNFLRRLPLDAISYWLKEVERHGPGFTLYKRFGQISIDDPGVAT